MRSRTSMPHDEKTVVALWVPETNLPHGPANTAYPRVYRNGIWAMQEKALPDKRARLIHVPSGREVLRPAYIVESLLPFGPYRDDLALHFVDMVAFLLPDKGKDLTFGSEELWRDSGVSLAHSPLPILKDMWRSFCDCPEVLLPRAGERFLSNLESKRTSQLVRSRVVDSLREEGVPGLIVKGVVAKTSRQEDAVKAFREVYGGGEVVESQEAYSTSAEALRYAHEYDQKFGNAVSMVSEDSGKRRNMAQHIERCIAKRKGEIDQAIDPPGKIPNPRFETAIDYAAEEIRIAARLRESTYDSLIHAKAERNVKNAPPSGRAVDVDSGFLPSRMEIKALSMKREAAWFDDPQAWKEMDAFVREKKFYTPPDEK